MLALLASACSRVAEAPGDRDEPLRIVSLSPAISRTLVDFDLGDRVIGRTQWCTSIDEEVPVVGDLLHVDYERLVRLDPTHILIQPRAAGPDRRLLDLAAQKGWTIGQWMLNDRRDIESLIRELPGALYREDPARAAAAARARDLLEQVDEAMRSADDSAWRGRVLLIDSVDPVMVYGHGTYLHDIVTSLGSENASNVEGWKELSLEDVTRLNPEAIIIVAPGVDARGGRAEALENLRGLEIDAVLSGRVAILKNADALLPSSAIIDVARELREILRSFAADREAAGTMRRSAPFHARFRDGDGASLGAMAAGVTIPC